MSTTTARENSNNNAPSLPPLPPLPADMGSLDLDTTKSSSSSSSTSYSSGMAITTNQSVKQHEESPASDVPRQGTTTRPDSISSRPRNKKKLGINTMNTNYHYNNSSNPPPLPSAPAGPIHGERQLSVSSSNTKLKPMQSQTSSHKTPNNGGGGSHSATQKLFSTAIKSLTPQTPNMPSSSTFLRSIGANAKFYSDPEAKTKLQLLSIDGTKFDEIMEFGFPGSGNNESNFDYLEPPRRGSKATTASDPVGHVSHHDDGFAFDNNRSNSPISEYTTAPPPSVMGPREMTLKITLSPPGMRANEEQIYGWQRDPSASLDTGTVKSLGAVDEVDNNNDVSPTTSHNNDQQQQQQQQQAPSTPSKKASVKRVLGRFKSNKAKLPQNTTPMMITSSDVNE